MLNNLEIFLMKEQLIKLKVKIHKCYPAQLK